MAGFVLKNTLSDNGAVTRGICQMNDAHYLTGVLETGGIEKTADGAAAGGKSIDIDSLVSMNMWALTPEFVELLESGFVEFFEKAAPANPLKAEYLLPIYIDELLHADKVSVKVLPTHDKWFGVTYAEDKQTVIDSFARLVADGVYKKDLFSDLKKKNSQKRPAAAGPDGQHSGASLLVENCKSLAHNAMESGGKTRYGYCNRSRITPHTPLQEGNHGKE